MNALINYLVAYLAQEITHLHSFAEELGTTADTGDLETLNTQLQVLGEQDLSASEVDYFALRALLPGFDVEVLVPGIMFYKLKTKTLTA